MAILGIGGLLGAVLAIIAGVLVLLFPSLLRVMIGLYLILTGVIGVVTYLF